MEILKNRNQYYKYYYRKNRQKRLLDSKLRYQKNPEYLKNWNLINKDRCLITKKKSDRKRSLNPVNRLNSSMRSAIHRSLSGKKECSWNLLVGYTVKELKTHIEKQFDNKMNWENYGTYWHIDHIKAVSKFPFSEVWKLENLRPLEAIYNIKKGSLFEVSRNNFVKFIKM